MIIDPDFLDHWKTQMLVDLLDDPCAPLYLIRIWSHCQNRKQTQFKPMPNPGLKALCRYPGDADKLVSALVESGFIEKIGDNSILVTGWEHHNAQLVAAWENGSKGGRPRKNPTETQPKPKGKPNSGLGEPDEKRSEKIRSDQIRSDERREEYSDCSDRTSNQGSNPRAKSKPPTSDSGSSDRLAIASSSLEITAAKIFRKCEYRGSDGGIFWQAAALVHKAAISENELWDACEAARLCGKNKPAYFRQSLSNALAKREIDLSESLKLFRITPSLPKSAPKDDLS